MSEKQAKCIKCPNCGTCLEEYGKYPYCKSKGGTICDAKCSGCGQRFKLIIKEVEQK